MVIDLADEPMLSLDLEPLEALLPEALGIGGEKNRGTGPSYPKGCSD